jgi:beta-glucosidase
MPVRFFAKSLLPVWCVLLAMTLAVSAQTAPMAREEAHRRAERLLRQMTVEEKIGQLNLAAGIEIPGVDMPGTGKGKPDGAIAKGEVGSVLWLTDVKELNRLQHLAVEKSRLHVPLLFGFDVIHGYRTAFPEPLAMASSWDPSVEESAQHMASEDARAAGIRWTFTPMVDIARDARWGRIVEGAGEDPYLGAAMAAAQVRGLQGESIGPDSVLACVKHFAGYGAADGGRDYDSSYIPEVLFRNVYLVPFHAAEKAGAASFMSAYMDLNDVPASGNRWLLHDILRQEWGFKGFVVSDAFAVFSLQVHGYARDSEDAAFKGFTAGVNMDMASQTYIHLLPKLMAAGKVTEAQLDAAAMPILEAKYLLGLFDHPYVDESKVEAVLSRPEGLALERKLAARSMVLLKNDNHTLPLGKDLKRVTVIGMLADSARDIEGGWNAEGGFGGPDKSHPVTVLAGLKNKLGPGVEVNYVPGPVPAQEYPAIMDMVLGIKPVPPPTAAETAEWLVKARAAAAGSDIVIAVLGEKATMSSEDASRATLDLPGIQEQMLEAAAATGKPVILILENGRPLDIRWAAAHVPAILEAWYPGTEGGNAVADVLFGDVNPGGKLPISWPRAAGQEPLYYNHNLTHQPDDAPNFTSRYWDMSSKPLYPFGYGLSYSTFKFANLRLSKDRINAGETTEVQVDVTNTGAVAGDAVAQIYIHQRAGSASRPVRQLKGFRRVTLQPGETQTLKFQLGKDELSFWSPQTKAWGVEPGGFDVWAGEDSTASLHAELTVVE